MSDCGCGGTCGGCGDTKVTLDTTQVLELGVTDNRGAELTARIDVLERAIITFATASLEFGDSEGHAFHGNQYSGGSGRATPEENAKRDARARGVKGYVGTPQQMKSRVERRRTEATAAAKYGFNHFGQSAGDHQYDIYSRNGRVLAGGSLNAKEGDKVAHIQQDGDGYRLTKAVMNKYSYDTVGTSSHDSIDDAMKAGRAHVKGA